jgi:hypothetical protein
MQTYQSTRDNDTVNTESFTETLEKYVCRTHKELDEFPEKDTLKIRLIKLEYLLSMLKDNSELAMRSYIWEDILIDL